MQTMERGWLWLNHFVLRGDLAELMAEQMEGLSDALVEAGTKKSTESCSIKR